MPVVLSAVVIFSGLAATPPVRDAATKGPVVEATLQRPLSYVLLAPLSGVFDTLTLISARQHIALLAGVIVLFVAWRIWKGKAGAGWRSHALGAAMLLLGIVLTWVAGALLPRPMASLTTYAPNIVTVDFHSHTDASHDGRMSVEANRRWHERAGFDVAWISDHGTTTGAEQGHASNPALAADGVMLLQSIELTWNGEHVGILGAERRYRGLRTENGRDVDPDALRLAMLIPQREPVVIWHHPRRLDRIPAFVFPDTAGVSAIEIANGAPQDMDRVRDNLLAILAFAERRDLALVSGTDNHGWGYAAPAWTLVRIAGWRGMNADSLATNIERVLRIGGNGSTLVVERTVAEPGSSDIALALSAVLIPWRMFTTISAEERAMWLVWIWAVTAVVWWWRGRRRRAAAAPA